MIFSDVLTLEGAKEIALENNAQYLSAKHTYQSEKWNEVNAFTSLLPSGTFSASQSQEKPGLLPPETNTRMYGYNLTQPVFLGGKAWLGYKMARDAKQIARNTLAEKKLEIIYLTEENFFDFAEAKEYSVIAEGQLESANKNLQKAEVRFEIGTISSTDYLKIKADTASKETELIQAETRYNLSSRGLRSFLGLQDNPQTETTDLSEYKTISDKLANFDTAGTQAFVQEAVQLASTNNFTLKTMNETKAIADKNVLMSLGNFLPSVTLSYSNNWIKLWDETLTHSDVDYKDSQTLGLSASIPIFPIADNFANYKKVRYQQRKTDEDVKEAENNINLAVESAVMNLISSGKQSHATKLTLEYTTELQSQISEKFNSGLVSADELLDSEIMLKGAKISDVQSKYAFIMAKSKLMQLLGEEDEYKFLQLINNAEEK